MIEFYHCTPSALDREDAERVLLLYSIHVIDENMKAQRGQGGQ